MTVQAEMQRIPRFNHLFIAVRVVKLYTHAVQSAPPAQKSAVQISPVQKKVTIFGLLNMDGRAYGNQNKKSSPNGRHVFRQVSTMSFHFLVNIKLIGFGLL